MGTEAEFELEEIKEIIDDFLVEADELVASLDTNLVTLENQPEDLELLNEIFRAAHTIKGTSSFLGFEQVTSLTHKMEDVLNKLRKAELRVTPSIMDVLLESLDLLKVLLNNVREGNNKEEDLGGIIPRLEAALDATADGGNLGDSKKATLTTGESKGAEAQDDSAGSVKKSAGQFQDVSANATGTKKLSEQTIRVDVNRLDSLMNLMGELVLSRNGLLQTIGQVSNEIEGTENVEKLSRAANSMNYITTELQLAVMKMRMQPIGKVFSRFPRLVRDLCRDLDKEIELKINGESTELDKAVIEEIADPLVHIIRNSCDHGIESPVEREKAGKPSKGTVTLSAEQEGSHIIISVVDDGRGLDVEAIRNKALERKLATPEELDRMSDKDVFRFIFHAGFSTAKQVSGVSGRGVGMDVVRTNIEKLNGIVELDSVLGQGTKLVIKLPLTLAIMQGLLVESDEEVYILPLASVHETVKSAGASVHYVNQRPVLTLRDEVIPIISLTHVLRGDRECFVLTEKPYIIIVGLADAKLGIMADRFLGQEEVVIKSLGSFLGNTEGVAGATILGDGRIRLIVDLIGLFNIARKLS